MEVRHKQGSMFGPYYAIWFVGFMFCFFLANCLTLTLEKVVFGVPVVSFGFPYECIAMGMGLGVPSIEWMALASDVAMAVGVSGFGSFIGAGIASIRAERRALRHDARIGHDQGRE